MPKDVAKLDNDDFSLSLQRPELASSLPPGVYTSEDMTEREINRFFRQSWIGVGRADVVSEPGDYIALDIAKKKSFL